MRSVFDRIASYQTRIYYVYENEMILKCSISIYKSESLVPNGVFITTLL